MGRIIVIAALTLSQFAAAAEAGPIDPGGGEVDLVGEGLFPAGVALGDANYATLEVDPRGFALLQGPLADGDTPRALDAVGEVVMLAPFWHAPPPCAGRAMAWAGEAGTVTVRWDGAGCGPTFSLTLAERDDEVAGWDVTFAYDALPSGGSPAPRAGVVVGAQVFELMGDGAREVPTDRAKALLDGSSDGTPGVWTITLDGAGAVDVETDPDGDGVRSTDNCERVYNPLQVNTDAALEVGMRKRGDACDEDDDNDDVDDLRDNCPLVVNSDQRDVDGDGDGDACDPDDDDDGLLDGHDLCPVTPDAARLDLDGDGRGDACDRDIDGDDLARLLSRSGGRDLCPYVFERGSPDADGDGLGDGCDALHLTPCKGYRCLLQLDSDGDGLLDIDDLCPTHPDRDVDLAGGAPQLDRDGDGLGDGCDADADGNGVLDLYEVVGGLPSRPHLSPLPGMGR